MAREVDRQILEIVARYERDMGEKWAIYERDMSGDGGRRLFRYVRGEGYSYQ